MKKILLIVLAAATYSMALNPFSYFWTIRLTGDTATVTKWKKNNDSVLAWSGKVADTLNKGIPRWLAFANHDSTFKWMNIDTIPSADTIQSTAFGGTRGTFTGVLKADSLASTKGVSATVFRGAVIGNVTGNVTGSSGSCTGNSATATTATNLSGGTVSATTGTFSGTLGVDSLASTMGVSATNGRFSSIVRVDSLASTKGVSATVFRGAVIGNVTGNVTGSSGSCTGNSATATNISGTYSSFACSLFVNSGVSDTFKVAVTCYYTKIGKVVTVYLANEFSFTCAAGSDVKLHNIPFAPVDIWNNYWFCLVKQNGAAVVSGMILHSGGVWYAQGVATATFGGTCKVYGTTFTFITS